MNASEPITEATVREWIAQTPIRILRLEPGDALAVQCHRRLSVEQATEIQDAIRAALAIPELPVLIIPPDLELSHVVRS